MSQPAERGDPRYVVAAVDKAMTLLECLARRPGAGVTEIAAQTGSTKSQAFRLLHTLEMRGYVSRDDSSRGYRLGPRNLLLGERAREQNGLLQVAHGIMQELADATGENVNLIVREGTTSVVVGLCESPQPVRLYAELGRRGPLHAGGGTIVMLAYAPEDVRDAVLAGPLPAYTPHTETDPKRLAAQLATIRRQGYVVAIEDLDPGAFSVAAPVRDHGGTVVAALSVAGPLSRLDDQRRREHVARVRSAAETISRRLGWHQLEAVEGA